MAFTKRVVGGFSMSEWLDHRRMSRLNLPGVIIEGNARVAKSATLLNDAAVYDNARISGSAVISDKACVYDDARVYDQAKVCHRSDVGGQAEVFGSAFIGGDAYICGRMRIGGTAKILGGTWNGGFEITEGVWHDPSEWPTNVLL